MTYCITPEFEAKFRNALKSGNISPQKLISMTSDDRRRYLAEFVGEFNAQNVNAEFESKLLLKNQTRGIITWANKVLGENTSRAKEIEEKVLKLKTALTPENEGDFLADIVERRLGIQPSAGEAKVLVGLAEKAKALYDPLKKSYEQSVEYLAARQALNRGVRELAIRTPEGGAAKRTAQGIIAFSRAVKVGMDLSAALRQGRAYLGTKQWNTAFKNMFRYAKDATALDDLEVRMMGNRYFEQVYRVKHKLGLTMLGETMGQREEQFLSNLFSKIPFFRGSERAYVGFLNDLRFNRFVDQLDSLAKNGRDITGNSEAMEKLAEVIGAATGRGSLGGFEGSAKAFSSALFSPRWLTSRFQVLTNPLTKTGPARVEALRSLGMTMGTTAMLLGVAKVAGADVELDMRSADFGKLKIGNTRFDITGGLSPAIVLLSRIATSSSRSATTGKVTPLSSGAYGTRTNLDLIIDYFTNRASPVASVARDLLERETFEGKKLDLTPETLRKNVDLLQYLTSQLFLPLITVDTFDAFNEASGGGAVTGSLSIPASFFGIGVQTFKGKAKNAIINP